MNDTRTLRFALIAAVAALAGTAGAQTAAPPAATASAAAPAHRDVSRGDRHFLEKAAAGGMAEVALGNMARERGGSDAVRQYGELMVRDHTGANEQVNRLAVARGVGTPTESDRHQRRTMERLGKLKGADFDQEFAKAMVEDHESTVELFEKQSKRGDDAELKAFATKTLPTLREHLEGARALRQKVQASR
ncbi:DUF4142 domain-containing protein [Rubrivivax gelatinosus]|nr:DUF4142 domain-containing protein [Rubrivivax gelatinosus]MBG6082341.1 putative membrane protein [Rubrivivax gelatinosus]